MAFKPFPYEIKNVEENISKELMEKFRGVHDGFVQVGPKKYFFPSKYKTEAEMIYNFEPRKDDVWVVTYPRSGTTWMQDIIWVIANEVDCRTARSSVGERWTFLEFSSFMDDITYQQLLNSAPKEYKGVIKRIGTLSVEGLKAQPSPRFIKSHLPFSLLNEKLLDVCKVVYIVRDPRDVALSFCRHQKLIKMHDYVGDFDTFWDYFKRGLVLYSPYFEHIKEAFKLRHHKNMLFLEYKDLCEDLPTSLKRIADFLNKQLTDEQISTLSEYYRFENFKHNTVANGEIIKRAGLTNVGAEPFFFQGKVGGWRDLFSEDMKKDAQEWMEDNLRGTGIVLEDCRIDTARGS